LGRFGLVGGGTFVRFFLDAAMVVFGVALQVKGEPLFTLMTPWEQAGWY